MSHIVRVAVSEQSIAKDREQRENRNQFDKEISQIRHSTVPFFEDAQLANHAARSRNLKRTLGVR